MITRSILSKGIYELWGTGRTYDDLHTNIRSRISTSRLHPEQYRTSSFKFDLDIYQSKCSLAELNQKLQQFTYLGFNGPIVMNNAEQNFCIFEDCDWGLPNGAPNRVFLGRWIAGSSRGILNHYTLKKRKYISTTSMDSELALLTANLTLAAPGKVFYDPFVGTGSFPIACAHFGATNLGSDIDGRSVRGKNGINILTNFQQYGLSGGYLDSFIGDVTHSPLRTSTSASQKRFLDGIICDPPYGVREGLKVLGSRDGGGKEIIWLQNGEAAHLYASVSFPPFIFIS